MIVVDNSAFVHLRLKTCSRSHVSSSTHTGPHEDTNDHMPHRADCPLTHNVSHSVSSLAHTQMTCDCQRQKPTVSVT
ncbi:hypothetical protein F2P81_021454 [Scophthalmus maximus]|uniref:Uncharacterized protein n=1 Tax=Scophthalmus maximus TaxID=52904 RepID=A0A6A4RQP0_SCOMX|nr:hypothetical protein F2P81_026415 [Scophthalmus maximus]KAF0026717.1 hypothetical protein F2P81_021454 [Scophthalmus maximus]